jgi:hypothetical protein
MKRTLINCLRFLGVAAVFFTLSNAVLAVPLKDDEVCKAGMDCTCGNVGHIVCLVGTTCQISVGSGSCHGPLPTIPTGVFSPKYMLPAGAVVIILGLYLLIIRRRKKHKE